MGERQKMSGILATAQVALENTTADIRQMRGALKKADERVERALAQVKIARALALRDEATALLAPTQPGAPRTETANETEEDGR